MTGLDLYSVLQSKGPKGATVPRPFNLSVGSKRRAEDATTQPYVPIAEQIAAFQRRTPDRYHLRSRQMQGRGGWINTTRGVLESWVDDPLLLLRRSQCDAAGDGVYC